MQVILIQDMKRLGTIGDVVNVKPGYARNYLIPNEKALYASEASKKLFEARRKEIEKKNQAALEAAQKASKLVEGQMVTLVVNAGEDGRLFGSVKASDISTQLAEKTKQDVQRQHVVMNEPIKYLGIYPIEIALFAAVSVKVNVNVARSDSEAAEAAERFARGEVVRTVSKAEEQSAKSRQALRELAVKAQEEAEAAEAAAKEATEENTAA